MNPIKAFFTTLLYLFTGRLHFHRDTIGQVVTLPDGARFTVFRDVTLDLAEPSTRLPGARFQVRFRVAGMSPAANKRFSWLPVLFFVGLPGFRAKRWLLDEATGEFMGLYQWDTLQAAQAYAGSFAMRFMTMRAVPGSLTWAVEPPPAEA